MQHVASSIQSKNIADLQQYSILFPCLLIIFYGFKRYARTRSRPNPEIALYKYLRKKYLNKVLSTNSAHIEKIWTWKLIEVIKSGIDTRVKTLETIMSRLPELVLKPLFACRILLHLWYVYVIWFIGWITLLTRVSVRINEKALITRHPRKEIRISMSKRFIRFLHARIEIFSSWKGDHEINNQLHDIDQEGVINTKLNNYLFLMYNIPIFFVQLLTLCSIIYAIEGITSWNFSYAIFTGLVTIIWFMGTLMIELTTKFKDISRNIVDIEKLREYLDDSPVVHNYDNGGQFLYKQWTITLNEITFGYTELSKVFEKFSLIIEWWKKIAFVGNSWSGKSTLVKIIAWLLETDSWSVIIDWQDITNLSLQSLYKNISFLQQEPIIFDGTIKENIEYWLSYSLDEQDIHTIIEQSQCQFVYTLPQWINTEVGEHWVRLSWWQKQRLAIARIFAKNPHIIILDEPTSSLDSFAEEEISKALQTLSIGKTVLIIAHRLQTVKEADEIIVLWTDIQWYTVIIERWNHQDLITQWWNYAKMLELQTGF